MYVYYQSFHKFAFHNRFFYILAFKLIDQETICRLAYCFIRSKYLSLNYTNTKVEYFLNIGEFSEGIIKEVEEYEHAN